MVFNPKDYEVVKSQIQCVLTHDFLSEGECNYKCEECQYHQGE